MQWIRRSPFWMGIIACAGILAALLFSPARAISGETGGITVWEVCTVNQSSLIDGRGGTPDWIEIKNTSDEPVSLGGFTLGDGRESDKQVRLPEVILAPGEYALFCVSGGEGWDGKYYHLPFRLSAEGELLLLGAPDGRIVQMIYIPPMAADESYGMTAADSMEKMLKPTPGEENSQAQPGYQAAPMGWVEGRR